jgi:hypothetical protein
MDHRAIPVLWKMGLTAVFGAFAYLITNVTDQSQIWQISITVFISGAALIVQYLMDFERRLESVETALEQHAETMVAAVRTGFAQVNEATRLFTLVERSPAQTHSVTELVRYVTQLEGSSQDIVHAFADKEITRLTALLKGLKDNQVEYEGEDHDWLLTLTESCAATIDATSTAIDQTFWPSELGRRYLGAQHAAVERGVRIRRLFIVNEAEQIDDQIKELRRGHEALGMEAKVVAMNTLPMSARLDPVRDFIVFDQAVSYEVSPEVSVGQPVIASTRLVLRDDLVTRRTRRFNELWQAAS